MLSVVRTLLVGHGTAKRGYQVTFAVPRCILAKSICRAFTRRACGTVLDMHLHNVHAYACPSLPLLSTPPLAVPAAQKDHHTISVVLAQSAAAPTDHLKCSTSVAKPPDVAVWVDAAEQVLPGNSSAEVITASLANARDSCIAGCTANPGQRVPALSAPALQNLPHWAECPAVRQQPRDHPKAAKGCSVQGASQDTASA